MRIFGRTTLVIQFTGRLNSTSGNSKIAYRRLSLRWPAHAAPASATRSATAFTVRGVALPSASRLARWRRPGPSRPPRRRRLPAIARACSAVLTPKPTATGRLVWRLMRATAWQRGRRIGRRRAGDAGDRDVVDEARRVGEHGGQALVVGRRRRQADEVEPGLERRQAELLVLLGRQVDDDQAVDAGGLGVGEEAVDAVDVDRIVVAHQHDRRRIVALAEGAHHGERLLHGLPGLERALAGAWIAGPSAIGSVNGMPSSITSAPAGSALRIASEVSGSGSPAVRKVTSAARPSLLSAAKALASMRVVIATFGSREPPQSVREGASRSASRRADIDRAQHQTRSSR